MTLNKEALQWNERVEHRDDKDGLNCARAIVLWVPICIVLWVAVLNLVLNFF